jgi:glycosyltransferase involved in cell wall biosynthesis
MASSLILLDDSLDVQIMLARITKKSEQKIISFDIMTHHTLEKLGIAHEKVEDYLKADIQNIINDLAIAKSTGWYKQKQITQYLTFEDLNLGRLLEMDLTILLIKTMKTFAGMLQIIKKERPLHVSSSSYLASIIKTIDVENKITINQFDSKNLTNKHLEQAIIPIKLADKSVNLWIPLSIALKIVKIIDHVFTLVFNLKLNLKQASKHESILLLDLNPKPYKELFIQLHKHGIKTVFVNLRGVPIWNLSNLKIIWSSKTKIIKLHTFLNPKLKSVIEQKKQDMLTKFLTITTDTSLNKYFVIDEHSFWPVIKDQLIKMCLKQFGDFIQLYELSKEMLSKIKIKAILALYHNPEEIIILHSARNARILSVRMQHYFEIPSKYTQKMLAIWPTTENGIKYGVWSDKIRKYLLELGNKPDDVITIGSPPYDTYFAAKNTCKNNSTILLGSNMLQNIYELSGHDTNLSVQHQMIFQEICKICNKIRDKKLIIKLHPAVINSYDVKSLLCDLDHSIPIYKTQSMFGLMKDCDVFVHIDHSTTILEAMILGKPTITVLVDSNWYEHDDFITSGATVAVRTPEEFEDAIRKILFNKEFRNDLVSKGNKFVQDYLANHGKASETLAKFISNFST